MTLAVMEGVAFALRDCIEVAKTSGLKISATKICGGGAKSGIWKTIISNVFGVPVYALSVEEGPAYGAAILAMVGAGEYPSVQTAAERLIKTKDIIMPSEALVEKYEGKYYHFKKLYPALKSFFSEQCANS
jgi:xylulokinase